ncbi:MAG: YggS family pyridoxal phosphate-dependent enzyme [Betaproteobacteria bacterium]
MNAIQENLSAVRARVVRAAHAAGRDPNTVALLAVSKTFPPESVLDAIACGQRAFGENYAREGMEKQAVVETALTQGYEIRPFDRTGQSPLAPVCDRIAWHFIGPLQSNKTRLVAENFDWVHSVDRMQIAQRLSDQRLPELPVLQICIQVNVSGETTKSGIAPDELLPLAMQIQELPHVKLRGLMTIPDPKTQAEHQRDGFRRLREMQESLRSQGFVLDTLSMGMSDDLEVAIAEGATIVRIGRAIFGERARLSRPG